MSEIFDKEAYKNLLIEFVPQAIETEEEYDRLLVVAERLTFAQNRSPEEKALHKLLVVLIEVYESQSHQINKSEPHEILQHIMESSVTRQKDLVGITGSSGVVSEIVNGRRSITKVQAKQLADYFKVSADLFF
ncbi:MAG: helix-turn-helix domain-containing protein [Xenococcaceae cyanobacterium]